VTASPRRLLLAVLTVLTGLTVLTAPALLALSPAPAASAASVPVAAPPTPAGQRAREVHGLLRAGKVDEAVAGGEALVRQFPSCGPCQVAVGAAYGAKAQKASVFTQLSWAKKCRGAFTRAIELEPASLEARFSLFQYDVNVPGFAGGGLDRARADVETIAKLSPSAGRLAGGMVKEKEKDLAGAEKEYRAAVATEPVDTRALRTLASFLQRQKRVDEAFEALRAYLARHPADAAALYQVGRLSASTGSNPEEGLASLDSFLQAPPGENLPTAADAWYRKGQILLGQGKKAEARASFERSLKEFPGHAGATEELAKP
jgi:tetratricopeptide (TPR) repeat protein